MIEKFNPMDRNQGSDVTAGGRVYLFDKFLFTNAINKKQEYFIGVDTEDKILAYCFGRIVDGVFEILLSKCMKNETEFNQEVDNLAKYFNANVSRSGD